MAVSAPQDGLGLANLYGGRDQFADKLDTIFTTDGGYIGYGAMDGVGGIHEQREAREVKLGQYGHSNQPSHHIPYMYLYSSRPWETQKYVRDIIARCYAGSTFGQGYIGDEDNGEMSAWYVLSSIGFYPLSMGNDEFAIGSPQFKEVTVNLEGNKKLVIKANNNSRENVYVDSMYVNGEKYDKTFIKYGDLIKGGTIEFNMSSTPNKERGLEQDSLTSITTGDNKPQVYTDYSKDADKSSSTGVTTLGNLFDDNSDTETKVDNTTTLMFKFTDKKAVRMLTLTSSKSGRTPDRAQVYGDNEDGNWVLLGDYHDSGSLFFNVWGKYTRPFGISADKVGKYSRYKVVLTGTDAYLSEVEMLGYKDNGILKSDLKNAIDVAKSIDTTGEYLPIAKRLENNLKEACGVYDNGEASDDEILKAYQSLGRIVDIEKKTIKIHDASQVEAEEFDAKSGHIINDGKNIGGVENNTWVRYDSVYFNGSASQVSFNYSGQKSDAGGYAQVYIDSKVGEPVATINLPVTGDHWSTYTTVSQQLEKSISGLHDVYIVFKNDGSNKHVANVDNITFDVKSVEGKEDVVISDKINIEGFQISQTNWGLRTVSSVEPEIDGRKVVEYGNIYAVDNGEVKNKDMVVGSTSKYVAAFKSTEKGIINKKFSASDTATNYVMTMKDNGSTKAAYTQEYRIRGYAKLSDGSYVYSSVSYFSIYRVSKLLYDNCKMSTNRAHEYLYNNILKVVDPEYKPVDYNWGSIVVRPK